MHLFYALCSVFLLMFLVQPVSAASVYGSLYEVGHAVSPYSMNQETTLAYDTGTDGFIGLTSNMDTGLEWWKSDSLGLNWEIVDPSPIAAENCNMAGRHTVVEYDGDVYFSAGCGDPSVGHIFKITGLETAELVHIITIEPPGGGIITHPTGTILNGNLYMFFDGGFTVYDGTSFADVIDAPGQTEGVPLETSEELDSSIYLAQTSGQVQRFDGIEYEIIGDNYLDGSTPADNPNLPAIEVFNDKVYVGNQDEANGATLFSFDIHDTAPTWEEVVDLDTADMVINKTQVIDGVDGESYFIFYVMNGDVGTNIYAMDDEENIIQLIDSGLGGTDPENNTEVVSLVTSVVDDGGVEKNIMLFGTQNQVDQSKLFVLDLGADLAIDATGGSVVSSVGAAAVKKTTTRYKKNFKFRLKKKRVKKGARYSLWVGGKKVDAKTAKKKKAITLKYKKAKKKKAGKTFNVRIGVKNVYGTGDDRLRAHNVIKGKKLKVTVRKRKK